MPLSQAVVMLMFNADSGLLDADGSLSYAKILQRGKLDEPLLKVRRIECTLGCICLHRSCVDFLLCFHRCLYTHSPVVHPCSACFRRSPRVRRYTNLFFAHLLARLFLPRVYD